MHLENSKVWKKQLKFERSQLLIKDFNLFIKYCYQIVWSVEKIQKVKTQKFLRHIKENCA